MTRSLGFFPLSASRGFAIPAIVAPSRLANNLASVPENLFG